MKLTLANNKDVWAGLMLIAIGAGASLWRAIIRSAPRCAWGRAILPVVLGGLLIVFGLAVLAIGLRKR
jgi:hypothetical protein